MIFTKGAVTILTDKIKCIIAGLPMHKFLLVEVDLHAATASVSRYADLTGLEATDSIATLISLRKRRLVDSRDGVGGYELLVCGGGCRRYWVPVVHRLVLF